MKAARQWTSLLIASLLVTACPLAAIAQDTGSSPDVEVDNSVLQQLNPSLPRTMPDYRHLPPIKLTPPPPAAAEPSPAPADNANLTPPPQQPAAATPPPAQSAPAQTAMTPMPGEQAPAVAEKKKTDKALAASKPAHPAKAEKLAKKTSAPAPQQNKVAKASSQPEIVDQPVPPSVAELRKMPVFPPSKPDNVEALLNTPATPTVTAVKVKSQPSIPQPPKAMAENAAIKAPTDGPVLFPIKTKTKIEGDLNPAVAQTAPAPVMPDKKTIQAMAGAMAQHDAPKEPVKAVKTATIDDPESLAPVMAVTDDNAGGAVSGESSKDWRKADPKAKFGDVPVPKARPKVENASPAFVKQARNHLLQTYTIMKHDGDAMPAVPKSPVAAEALAAPRLSVADLKTDPLAKQLLDMSPQDVAQALNQMAPTSANDDRHLLNDLNNTNKPRIVRENGDWKRHNDAKPAQTKTTADASKPADKIEIVREAPASPSGTPKGQDEEKVAKLEPAVESAKASPTPETAPPPPAAAPISGRPGHVSLNFKPGDSALDPGTAAPLDQSVISSLKQDPAARMQIVAFASAPDSKESTARRIALSRALAVRSYLIGKGVDPTKLDVRAMGLQTDSKEAADKVDMIVVQTTKS